MLNVPLFAKLAAQIGLAVGAGVPVPSVPRARREVTPDDLKRQAEINAWNDGVRTRQVRRAGSGRSKRRGRREAVALRRVDPPQPKIKKPRAHWQWRHPLRDDHGAYTEVGRDAAGNRRKWLGGFSAQRGY